jgi:hypothetical protein
LSRDTVTNIGLVAESNPTILRRDGTAPGGKPIGKIARGQAAATKAQRAELRVSHAFGLEVCDTVGKSRSHEKDCPFEIFRLRFVIAEDVYRM